MRTNASRTMGRLMLTALALGAAGLPDAHARDAGSSQADLVQRVLPGVVTIFVRKNPVGEGQGGATQVSHDAVLDYANGAGFVISPDGLIVTNRHNVEGARQLIIGFSDGSRALGTIVGAAQKIDLALLKVNMDHKLVALMFGDSEKVRVGDPVLGIGNPLGVGTSVSAGIVSALNRDIKDSVYDDFIQTDAAINHGNSGGPLIDQAGQVIGMNSDIFSNSGGSMGLGFALSSNVTKFVVDRLLQYGRVKAGWVGLDLQDLSPAIAWSFREPKQEGAVVTAVTPGGPAMAAGIAEGDIIQRIGDSATQDARDAARKFALLPVGDTTHVTIWHDGGPVTVDVHIAEIPGAENADNPAPLLNQFETGGLKLAALTDQARQNNNLAPGQPGVLVAAVSNDVFTGLGILLPGDVILRVQQTAVASPAEVEHRIAQAKTEGLLNVSLLVQRKSGRSWIPLLIGELTTK
jgi:serine protease Do